MLRWGIAASSIAATTAVGFVWLNFPSGRVLALRRVVHATANPLEYETSWLGNTFGGGGKWVQGWVQAIQVSPDGTVFTNSQWDEGGREAGVYRNGDAVLNPEHTHGWGQSGGRALAVNRNFLYLGAKMDSEGGKLRDPQTWPAKGENWFGVSRRQIKNPSQGAPFAGGKGGRGDTLRTSFLVVNAVREGDDAQIAGMAADDEQLYVSNPSRDEVSVYDANTMRLLNRFGVHRPGGIALDRSGTLWVIQTAGDGQPPRILRYARNGSPSPDVIDSIADPRAIAVDNEGRLLVADAGPRQQILFFDVSASPRLVHTLGEPGGVLGGTRGFVGDLKFAFPAGVGADASGNIYVASSTPGTDIRKFSPSGKLQWRVLGLVSQEAAVADPDSGGTDLFTKSARFRMDYSKPAGREWTWTAVTLDPFRYPDDPRLTVRFLTASAMRRIQGKAYLCLTADNSALLIFRLDGTIAVPSVAFAPRPIDGWLPHRQPGCRYIWRDCNGDGQVQRAEFLDADGGIEFDAWGWDVDSAGNVWEARESEGLRKFPLQTLDRFNNPVYTRKSSVRLGIPEPFTTVERVKYIAGTDSLYVSGYTRDHPKLPDTQWGLAGTEIARFDHPGNSLGTPVWRAVLPYTPPVNAVKAFTVAGDRLFAAILASSGSGQTADPQNIYIYDAKTGTPAGRMTPGPEVGSRMGWVDIGQGVQAAQLNSGEYALFVEEVAWQKVLLYRSR